jgi:hypothetical protein
MAKPTPFQQKVIKAIANELDYWNGTNDIHSPSHATSIEHDMFVNLDEWWPDLDIPVAGERYEQLNEVAAAVRNLWAKVAHLDECHIRAEQAARLKKDS